MEILIVSFLFVGPALDLDFWIKKVSREGGLEILIFCLLFVEPALDLDTWIKKRLVGERELKMFIFLLSFCRTHLGL